MPHWNGRVAGPCPCSANSAGPSCRLPQASRPPYCSTSCSCCSSVSGMPFMRGQLVERAGERALHAGAVVAPDVDHERVVELAHLRRSRRSRGRRSVGVLREAGVDLHLARVDALLVLGRESQAGNASGRGCQLRVGRDDAELLLPRERLLAAACPSPGRTCPCTCRPTRFGTWCGAWLAARSRSTRRTASPAPGRERRAAIRSSCRPSHPGGSKSPSCSGHADDRCCSRSCTGSHWPDSPPRNPQK